MSIPWKKILSCPTAWIISIEQFGHAWSFFTLITQSPTYFKFVQGMSTGMTGIFSGGPYVLKTAFSVMFAYLLDTLMRANKLSRINARKLSCFVCSTISGFCIIAMGFSGCNYTMAVTLQTIAIMVHGAFSSGALVNIIDIAPNFSGIILSVTLFASSASGFISPIIVANLTLNNVQNFVLFFIPNFNY